jgi:hypothetical protein
VRAVLVSIVQSIPETRLVVCESVDRLVLLVNDVQPWAVVAQPRDLRGVGVVSAAPALLGLSHLAVMVVVFTPTLGEIDEVCAVLEKGLVGVLVPRWSRDATDLGESLRAALLDPPDQGAERVMLERVAAHVVPALRPFFAACALIPPRELTVSCAVRRAGSAVRTLEERLSRAGYPSARAIVAWHRILHAAWRLDVRGLSIKSAIGSGAENLGSRRALANVVKRYTGLTLGELRQPGRLVALLSLFTTLLGLPVEKGSLEPNAAGGGDCAPHGRMPHAGSARPGGKSGARGLRDRGAPLVPR